MNSSNQFTWKNLAIGALLVVGFFASARLSYLFLFSRNALPAPTADERRASLIEAMEAEKEQAKKLWIESGKPLPPGGFDVVWKRISGFDEGNVNAAFEAEAGN